MTPAYRERQWVQERLVSATEFDFVILTTRVRPIATRKTMTIDDRGIRPSKSPVRTSSRLMAYRQRPASKTARPDDGGCDDSQRHTQACQPEEEMRLFPDRAIVIDPQGVNCRSQLRPS